MKRHLILYLLIIFLYTETHGQNCLGYSPPTWYQTRLLDCDGTFDICMVFFNVYADFDVVIKYPITDFNITESSWFDYSKQDLGYEYYVSNDKIFSPAEGAWSYCFTGVDLQIADKDITITLEFSRNNELCFTQEVVLKKLVTISGTNNLSDLIGSQDLLDATEAANNSQNLFLDGTLSINTDYIFGNDANGVMTNIMMGEEAKIIVEDGYELSFGGTNIKDCGAEWDRIELMPNSILNTYYKTFIQGGRYGLYMHESSEANLLFTNFISNEWGIYAPKDVPYSVNLKMNGASFDGGIYASSAIGMELYDMPYTFISYNVSPCGPIYGQFKNLKYGIKAFNSNISLDGPTMENISHIGVYSGANNGVSVNSALKVADPHCDGLENFRDIPGIAISAFSTDLTVDHITTSNVNRGIWINSVIGYTTSITNSQLYVNSLGIELIGRKGAYGNISHNNIVVYDQNGVNMGKGIYGLAIPLNTDEWNINHNSIENIELGPGIRFINFEKLNISNNTDIIGTNYPGVEISGGSLNKVSCNDLISNSAEPNHTIVLHDSPIAIISCNLTVSGNDGILINGPCEQSEIWANHIQSSQYDLQYGLNSNSYSVTKLHDHQGNCFDGSYSTKAKHFTDDPTIVEMSQYIVPNVTTCYKPTWQANGDWFISRGTGNRSCADPCVPGLVNRDTSLDRKIKNGTIGSHEYQNSILYGMRSRMYQSFMEDTVPSGYESFMSGLAAGNVGLFYNVRDRLKFGLNFTTDELTGIDSLTEQINFLEDTLAKSYTLDTGFVNYTEIEKLLIDSLINELRIRQIEMDTFRASRDARLDTILPICLDMLDEITPSNIVEANQKTMYQILIPYMINHKDTISEEDLGIIDTIATQCDLLGGEAVFQARAIIYRYRDTIYNDETLCYSEEEILLSAKRAEINEVKVIPNPSDEMIKIKLENGHLLKKISIFDISGREVEFLILNNESLIDYSTKMIKDGLYIIQIEDQKGNRYSKLHLVYH